MAAVNTTSFNFDEELRKAQEAARKAEEEAARAQKEAEEQARRAQEETERAAQEAEQAAADSAKQAQSAKPDVLPEVQETAVPMPDAQVQQTDLDALLRQETRNALDQTKISVSYYDELNGYVKGMVDDEYKDKIADFTVGKPVETIAGGNEVYIDYGSIKSPEQAFMIVLTGTDNKAKNEISAQCAKALGMRQDVFDAQCENYVYDRYGRQVYSTPKSDAGKNRYYMQGMSAIGLMDTNGDMLDMTLATPQDVMHACRMDPNEKTADTAYKLAQYGSTVPGNMWYGMTVTKDMFTFVDSVELTKKDYDAEVSAFDQSFSHSDMDGNKTAYLDNYQYILDTYGGNKRVFNSMVDALNDSFYNHTNLEAPDEETVRQALAQAAQAVSAEGPAGEEEQKKRWWNALGDWVKTNLLDLPSAEERRETERRTLDEIQAELDAMEAQENAPEQDGAKETQSSGSSVISSGGVTSVGGQDVSFSPPVASAAMTSGVQTTGETQDVQEMQPPASAYKKSEVQGPIEQKGVRLESAAYDPNMSDVQAWMLHQQGYMLDPRNQAQIEKYLAPEVRGVLTNERGKTGSGFEISEGGAAWPVAEVTGRRRYGPELGEVMGLLGSTSLEGEALALAQLQTMDIVSRLQEYAATPYTPERPQGVNAYTWALSQNPEIAAELSTLKKQLISGNSMHGEMVANDAQERDARMQGYVQAALSGSATPEMLASLSEYYAGDMIDVQSDESRNKMSQRLYGNGALFATDSDFWDGDSLAAAEGRNIRTAGGMQGFLDFCDDMTQRTQDILDSFTTAANQIGMTLEDYLGSAGITDIRQIADIAYNEIRAQGAAILRSPEMIAEVDAAVQNPVGLSDVICGNYELSGLEATKLGAGIGLSDYVEGLCQTSYMVLDAATYTQTRQRLMEEWYGKYGELAPQMYRRAINMVLSGDSLSEEMKAELSRNMDGVLNIFDLAYEIDPGMLKGVFRYGRAEQGKKVEKLQSVKDMLTPEQQVYVDFFAGGTNSLTGMAVNAVAAGAGAVIGAPAAVAKTAGALLGTGFNAFEDAYDENFHARGMDREHAAAAAFGDAVFMTATEYLTPDLATDLLFGGQTQQAMVKAARKSPASFFRTMAKTTFARAVDEGKEEVIQTLGGHVFNILDNLYIADQNGEKVTPSLAMKTVLSGFANTDWGELGKETLQSGLGGFGYGLVFGLAGTAAGMLPGGASRAALADGKAFRSYESVKLACGIADGSVEASTENLGRLYTLLGSDLQDPKFCMYIDRSSQQAATSRQVMTAMLEGEAADALERAGEHADKAKAYGDKADAAKAAVSQSQEDYMALRETVSGGEIDKVPALEAAQQRWAKAQTAYNEASEAANKERDKAGRSAKEWLDACMAKAQTYTAEGMKVQMNRIAALRDGMARRLDALYTQMEQARGTYETELARSADLEVEEMTDEEIDAAIGEMADVENRAQQAQEMGMDEDTVNAIREQGSTDESRARREAIIRNQRNEYASLQSRMQTAQELSDTDAYDQLKARQDIAAQRIERLGVPAVDPNAEANARQAANRERIRDVATGTTAQQREEARVREQEAANIREMDADAYIEQNHPDASEEDKAKLRELYGRIAGEQTASAQDEPASGPAQDGISGQGAQEKTGGAAASTDGLRMMARLSNLYGFRTEVVEDDDPRLKGAEGGYERSTNTMYIPKGITQSQSLVRVLAHELTHFSENGTKSYDAFQKALLALRYGGDKAKQDADAASIIRQYNEHYRANNQTNADGSPRTMDEKGALSELTAKIMAEILSGNQDMITRLTQKEPGIARRIADTIRDFIGRLRGVKGDGIDQLARVERMFRRALKKAEKAQRKRAGEYRMAAGESSHPGSVQFSVSQLAEATGLEVRLNDDGVPYSLIDKDGNDVTSVTPDMLTNTPIGNLIRAAQAVGTIDQNTADAQMQMFADLTTLAAQYKDQAMVWEIAGSQMFSAIKDNSDKQYGTTVDFGTICAKTQAIVDVMSETMVKLGRGLTRQEVIDAYRETAGVGYNVPCPVCYVFSRWMGVPSLLGNMASYQDRFSGMSESEVRAYVTDVENRYSDGSGKPSSAIAKAKSRIEGKLARIEKKMLKLTAQGKSVESLVKQAKPLEDELSYIEAYNWVTQVLCKKNVRDANGQVVLDPDYTPVPKDILLDLRKTGEFANDKYKKSWTYRTTRGAGMGKAILPHSGARIGDTVKGTKDRWTDIQNAFLTGDDAQAQRAIENAIRRMKAQNLIGGQRFQSTSDYRPEWGIDYMMTFLEMQAIGAKGQLYTKVIEAVDMFATAGIEVNLSIMPKGNGWHVDENGNKVLDFSSVTGIDFDQAYEKTRQYDNVQMILVGINDDHIELAMADDRIGFIIPWHASGNSGDTLTAMMDAVGEKVSRTTDYTRTQSDKANSKATQAQKNAMDLRMRILTGDVMRNGLNADDHVILESNPYLADLYNRFCVDETETETYGVSLSSNQASQVFPFEYWDTSLNRDQADENGRRFVEYCESIGLKPRFPQFADKPGYWKLLIDRPMYNLDGTYHHPKQIDVSGVEIGSIAQSVGEVKYGDSAKTEAAAQAVLDDIRARLPAEQFAAGAETDMQYSLRSVSPVEQKSTDENGDPAWIPGHSEQWFRENGYPIYADVPAEQARADGASADGHGTQISSTKSTYRKIFNRLKENNPTGWQDMKVLDASSGLGIGTRIGRNMGFDVDDIEPFPNSKKYGLDASEFGDEPEGSFYPNYTDYSYLQDMVERGEKEQYDYIISNAVLNVIPQDTRDNLVSAMASLLKPGGQMFINVISRNYQGAIDSKAETQYVTGKSGKQTPVGSVRTQEGDYRGKGNVTGRGHETFVWKSNSVQKVFSTNELMAYLRDALGDGYTVRKDTLGMTGVTVKKDNASASDVQHALPSDDVLEQEIRDWMAGREAQLEEANKSDGVSRFAADTVQRIEAVPVRVRQEFDTNPILRSYKTDSNADQIARATDRIESAGYQSEVDRLLEAESFNADDNVEAGMIALAAFENGDIRTGLDMALKYRIAGTEQGKALQSRKVLSKMTPTHMALKISADMEKRLADTAKALPEKAKDVARRAADVQKALDGLSTVDETQRILNEGGTIDRNNNVQGAVVNEQQRAAIRHYGLEHTDRKIDHYNRATLKQRMLEFILDTPDLSADTGNGITGYQRLEWMKEGKAVMTNTDLRHIMAWATAYGRLSDEEQAGRMGDILMGRIAEAYANMTPATSFEKARTSRFVNMLMSLTSAKRNVMGNGLQNAVDAVTHDTLEVGLDKLVGLATGKRTKAELTFSERAEGWRAFVDETVNTFHDYFVDEVDTTPRDQGTDRFDSAKRGRVYQGGLMHGAQQLEGFLMSFGDRNFYKRAYVNSINEQIRVAEMNGLAPDMDAILLQAKQDADYATFNEDGKLRRALSSFQNNGGFFGNLFSLYCPFTGVPTNIAKRGFVEYSPLGAVLTVGTVIKDAAQGRDFNQRRFVEGMARSVTGSTMLLGMGYLMAANGMYFPGTGDEEDQNVAALLAAEGQQYSPFIRIGDTYVSLGAFAPAIYPVTIGATIYNTIKKSDGDRGEAIKNAMIAISNQFFDSTFMSGLTEVFNTQNSTVPENIIATLPKTAANQMVPFGALLSQVATGLDTYARDTKDASVILRAMKDAAARIPFLREKVLDVKTDITGRPVESKPGIANNLLNPLTTTQAVDDPALTELDRLYDALGTSAHIPSTLIKTSGKVTILAAVADNRRVAMDRKNGEHNLVLTAKQRNQYNRMYASLCFDGTGDGDYVRLQGIDTRFTGIRDLMETPAYKRADDQEKAGMISDIIKKAKQLTHAQMVYDLGYMK